MGTGNTAVGSLAGPNSDGNSNTGAFGYMAVPTGDNRIHIGNTTVGWIGGQVGWSTYDDERFKENVNEDVPGLEFIQKLRPVTYHWNVHKLDDFFNYPESVYETEAMQQARTVQESKTYTGFMAQEVEAAALELGFDFSGVQAPQNENTPYSISYAEFVVPLVKAVQEQQALIEQMQQKINELESRLEK